MKTFSQRKFTASRHAVRVQEEGETKGIYPSKRKMIPNKKHRDTESNENNNVS